MKNPLEIRQLIINEFIDSDYLKRTSKGLAKSIDMSIDIVENSLSKSPMIFTKTTGCKGEMWTLNDEWR